MSSIPANVIPMYIYYNDIVILNTNGNKNKNEKIEKISTTESIIKDDTAKCWAALNPHRNRINARVMCV